MGLFNRKIIDWKIRNLASAVGIGTIILAIATLYVLTQVGYTKVTLLRNEQLGSLNLIAIPLSPEILANNQLNFNQQIKKIERIIFSFEKGGEMSYGEELVTIPKPQNKAFISSLKTLRNSWDTYKSALFDLQEKSFNGIEQKNISVLYTVFIKNAEANNKVVKSMGDAEQSEELLATIFLMVYVVFLVVMIILIMRYLILGPLYKVSLASRELAMGNLTDKIEYDARNEVGYIAKNTNSLADILKYATDFTKQIGEGKLDAKYKGLEKNENALATSLLQMREQMSHTAKVDKERNWATEGLAKFADILRSNNDNIQDLSFMIVSNLVKYIGANQGALFIISKEEHAEKDDIKIVMEAAYAYERRKRVKKEMRIGEGLVGQVVQEGDKIYLTDVPENYVEIRSGLGETLPRSILIVPLKINGEIKGVVEIASINEIASYKIDFVEKLGENIASTIANTQTNERTKKLLEESQSMTEQMRSQEEEMRQNMEEMEATQEEMGRAQQEMESKESTLNALINNTTDSIILIDKEYAILVMNQVIKDRYKGTQYEVMKEGSNALDMLGDVREEWKGYYDSAFSGERLSFTIKSSVKGENAYRHYDINPISDHNGNITGASIFSRDNTNEKTIEEEKEKVAQDLKRRGYVMDALINNTNDTFFAINTNYEILVVNTVLKKRFEESKIDLSPGVNILTVLAEDQVVKWKARYDQALAGENVRLEEIRELSSGNLVIETRCEPIKNTAGEVIGVSTVSKDITDLKTAEKRINELEAKLNKQ
ncbi:MAG: PAS domain S-box-containing protein [Marivirga sp.]|jgi:PAS domain S-box-containing protein